MLERGFKISSFVAGIIFLALSLVAKAEDAPPSASKIYSSMSVEQRVGQVFIWTYPGQALNSQGRAWLEKYQPGGLIVFSRNIKSPGQIGKFNSDLQSLAAKKMKAPFFLMIDQEGGTVTRLRTSVPLPSALALGKLNDAKFVRNFGKAVAGALKYLGFNVNLAPVLDVAAPTKESFIGNRAFGQVPTQVSEQANAYAEGLSDGGILPTAKHFPGHGGVAQDSHQTMPKKLATYEEAAEKDLIPFADYSQSEYPRAMMMAHMAMPNIDPTGAPATYSSVIIQETLRDKLNYDGLIMTDDLEMAGASSGDDVGQRAIRAFVAGNDMLMLAGSAAHQRQAFTKFLAAVKDGKITETRLRESVERIIDYKRAPGLKGFVFHEQEAQTAIAEVESLSKQVLRKNFQIALDAKTALWPIVSPETQVLVLSSDSHFFRSFQERFKGKARFYLLTPSSLLKVEYEIQKSPNELIVYYASGAQTARWLSHLSAEERARTIVINANQDAEVEFQGAYLGVLNVSTNCSDCGLDLAASMNESADRTPAVAPSTEPQTVDTPKDN